MTQLKLVKGLLASRSLRERAGGIKGKLRYLDLKNEIIRTEKKGFLDKVGDFFNNPFVGFITGAIFQGIDKFASSLVAAIGFLRDRATQFRTFDWAASDKELEALIAAQSAQAFSAWGRALGRLFGWVVQIGIGYGISLVVPVVGGTLLAKRVAAKVITEGGAEVAQTFSSAISVTAGAGANAALISSYINIRKAMNGGRATETGGVNMSLSARYERQVESIKDANLRALVEGASDEFEESFWENGMIIAHEIDAAYEQSKLANEAVKGKKRTVRLRACLRS
jgi:hypothetical protein